MDSHLLIKIFASLVVGYSFQMALRDISRYHRRTKIYLLLLIANCFFIGWGSLSLLELF